MKKSKWGQAHDLATKVSQRIVKEQRAKVGKECWPGAGFNTEDSAVYPMATGAMTTLFGEALRRIQILGGDEAAIEFVNSLSGMKGVETDEEERRCLTSTSK